LRHPNLSPGNLLLRPEFTVRLAERLLQGEAINLTGAHGLGRRQTLADLATLLKGHALLLRADMKFTAGDYQSMLDDLGRQTGEEGASASIDALLTRLPTDQPVILMLHNFDLLRSKAHDPRFDHELLPRLGDLANRPELGLLTVCEEIYDDWPLPCTNLPLPPLP